MLDSVKKKLKQYRQKCKVRAHQKLIAKTRKQIMSCGENLEVYGNVTIYSGDKLVIKDNCILNDKVYINARSGVYIGNDVTISYDAKIISTGYDLEKWVANGERIHKEDTPIHIGDHCWIGAGAIILPGVKITGNYVVVGAGAVVTKDITESYVAAAGSPARIVKRLDGEVSCQ